MSIWQRIKTAFNNYFTRLAASNKELFEDNRPDCCKLNDQNAIKK